MIVISGTFEVESADLEAALVVARTMAEKSRAEEGCRTYGFSADLENPRRIRVFEIWESEQALKRHFETPHMAEFRAALADLRFLSREVWRYDGAEKSRLL